MINGDGDVIELTDSQEENAVNDKDVDAIEMTDSQEDNASQGVAGDANCPDSEESSEMTASEDESSWISWFINIRGNDFFCEVEEPFVQDDFNLTGLSSQVPYYDYALDMILDVAIPLGIVSLAFLYCMPYFSFLNRKIH
jgi:hypothetical protein